MGHSIDEQRLRNGTQVLYKKFQPWKMPPYSDEISEEAAVSGIEDEKVLDGIHYFYSGSVQEGLKAAADFKKKYFSQFPDIKQFIKDCSKAAEQRGWVKTWTGRRRHLKDPKKEAYKAPNAVIQGGAGDIMKVKLWELVNFLKPYKTKVINSVHDEVCFMVNLSELDLIPRLNEILCNLPFRVPISWGIEWGFRWGEKHDFTTLEDLKKELGL
jgi:DNA polymerase I-like protein with 3'-5' exonuclease and polymerase domains